MDLVLFTKMLPHRTASELCDIAQAVEVEALDLCVRDGFPVSPLNVETALPKFVKELAANGIRVPMVTGPGEFAPAENPVSQSMMRAMGEAGVRLYKLGYQFYNPRDGSYSDASERFREELHGWQKLAEKCGVTVCYHTHCGMDGFALGHHMGCSAGSLRDLLHGLDPRWVGAYLDPGNLLLSGESFSFGAHICRDHLVAVGLQDVFVSREPAGDEGRYKRHWVPAGHGAVPWSDVFRTLRGIEFNGQLPIHAEFEGGNPGSFETTLKQETQYFRRKIQCL